MALSISTNGVNYEGWNEAFVERSIETCAASFGFSTSSKDGKFIPIREGDLVEIFADGILLVTGYIDDYSLDYDAQSHRITIKGRSKTQDFIDSTVPEIKEWTDYSLFSLINSIAKNVNVEVIDLANISETFFIGVGAEIGETCFDFCEKYVKFRQALLTDDEFGRLVITKPNFTLSDFSLKNKIGEKDNNIKAGSRNINLSQLYGRYIAQLQGYPIDFTKLEELNKLFLTADIVRDPEIRESRYYEFFIEEIITIEVEGLVTDLKERAQWEMAMRRAKNSNYSLTVQGHSFDGKVFKENQLYQIDDDFIGIADQLFCNKLRFNYNLTEGSTTTLNFTNKNSYTLQAERDKLILNDP